jgi:hypothetical protein
MICKKCDFQNEETAKFCRNCGTKLMKHSNVFHKITNKKHWLWIVGGLLVIAIVVIFLLKKDIKIFDLNSSTPIQTNFEIDMKQLVQEWNKAHISKDINVFSNLFDNTVLFYGTQKSKKSCIESKSSSFKKYPDFYQQIYGDIQIENIDESEVKCSFVKRVTVKQVTTDYPSYLIFRKIDGDWKIITEGDLVTDKNLAKTKTVKIPEDAIKGDFNGDGVFEYAWLVPPKIDEEGMECVGDCISYIKFSETTIPPIKINDCISGRPDNLGDLNNDGKDEIGLLPGWFTSCWRAYYVWTLKNRKWIYAVQPISTHCNQWEEGIEPIEIDFNKKGYVLIRYSELTEDDIITKIKSVPIK